MTRVGCICFSFPYLNTISFLFLFSNNWAGLLVIYQNLALNWRPEGKLLSGVQLCDPMDYIVHGILQARILEWVAFPFSRASSQPRDQTQLSYIAGGFFTSWVTARGGIDNCKITIWRVGCLWPRVTWKSSLSLHHSWSLGNERTQLEELKVLLIATAWHRNISRLKMTCNWHLS